MSFGLIDQKNADINNQNVSRKENSGKEVSIKPFKEIRNAAVQRCAQDNGSPLLFAKTFCFVKVPQNVYLEIAYKITGKYQLCHMQDICYEDSADHPENAVVEEKCKKVKAGFELNAYLFCQIEFPPISSLSFQ